MVRLVVFGKGVWINPEKIAAVVEGADIHSKEEYFDIYMEGGVHYHVEDTSLKAFFSAAQIGKHFVT